MAKCIIIAPLYAGEEAEWLRREPGDLLLCADGGLRAARRAGMTPDLVIGDFDSMPEQEAAGCGKLVLPVHKDDTDMVVCLNEGRRLGYREFRIAGALGGRLDHTIANLQCLTDCALRGEEAWLCDDRNRITALPPGRYVFDAAMFAGAKLSLLAATERVRGVSLNGTEWELEGAELTNRYPLGVSNEVHSEVTLSIGEGVLYLLRSSDAPSGR